MRIICMHTYCASTYAIDAYAHHMHAHILCVDIRDRRICASYACTYTRWCLYSVCRYTHHAVHAHIRIMICTHRVPRVLYRIGPACTVSYHARSSTRTIRNTMQERARTRARVYRPYTCILSWPVHCIHTRLCPGAGPANIKHRKRAIGIPGYRKVEI
jgi:hypothetical protein